MFYTVSLKYETLRARHNRHQRPPWVSRAEPHVGIRGRRKSAGRGGDRGDGRT